MFRDTLLEGPATFCPGKLLEGSRNWDSPTQKSVNLQMTGTKMLIWVSTKCLLILCHSLVIRSLYA